MVFNSKIHTPLVHYQKIIRVIFPWALAVLLVVGLWTNDVKKNEKKAKKLSVETADGFLNSCADESTVYTISEVEQKNPNTNLFIGCSGFFE